MRRLAAIAALLCAVLAGLSAALINGYPLVFYDSGDYIAMSYTFQPLIYRTIPYSVFLRLSHLDISLWGAAVAQALVSAWCLHEFIAAFAPAPRRPLLLALASLLLAVFSSLPWIVGQLMPDAFAAPLVLAMLVLLLERGSLGRPRRLLLAAIVVLGGASHLSQLAIAIGLLALALILRLLWPRRAKAHAPRLRAAALAVLATLVFVPGLNFVLTGRIFLSEAGPIFLIARFAQDGLLQRHLQRACPDAGYALCGFQSQIPNTANDFLWKRDSALVTLGGWYGLRDEAARIVGDSLRADPQAHLRAAAANALEQVVRAGSGEGLFNQWETTRDVVHHYFPREAQAYERSLQQRERLNFSLINYLQVPIYLAALSGTALLAILALARGHWRLGALGLFMLAAVLGNAAICGILSNPTDRYQARVAWLPLFLLIVLAAEAWAATRAPDAAPPRR